uniref:Insulinase family protein n=1 Tax=Desulfobacca acetoxidans TaxID=60893 RepID=A0A7C3YZF1_9BACT
MTLRVPEIYQVLLPTGLELLGVEYERVPWVSLTCMVKRGAETDPPDKAGAADWTAEYLTLGTVRRSQRQLAEDVESLGAQLQARAEYDATYISLDGLAEDFPVLMEILAEVVQTPGFPPEEFPLLKDRRRAELAQMLDDPRELATRSFRRLFFGGAPYGHATRGEPESLETLALADLTAHYAREFSAKVTSLVVVGMVPQDRVEKEVRRLWQGWPGGGPASPAYTAAPERLAAPGVYLFDRPELTQSEIRMGHLGLPRHHPDYFPLRLANYILGEGGFSSRLMARIRSDLGFTYGIRSRFHFRRAPGPFMISTFTPAENTARVVEEITGVVRDVQEKGVTAQELAEAQSYFVGHFPQSLETARTIAHQVANLSLYDLGLDYLAKYCERIQEVTLEAAGLAARTHLHPEALSILVVGPAAKCKSALENLGGVTLLTRI